MAATLLHSLTNEKKKKQKQQIGCMTGFIQLFERNQVVLPKRITAGGYSHGSVFYQDESKSGRESCEVDQPYSHYHQHASEVRSNRNSSEKLGTESSRASFSSSRSSSFSSPDYNKVAQPEPSSLDRIIFPECPSLGRSLSHSSSSWRLRQRSLDFEEADEVSLPAKSKEQNLEVMGCESENSLSPLQVLKPKTNGSPVLKQSRLSASKAEQADQDRQSSIQLHDSMGSEGSAMLKELPRLSLDSRKSSIERCGMRKTQCSQRPPSIMEKLMGLEAMPESRVLNQNKTELVDSCSTVSSPCMPLLPSSPGSSRKDYNSVQKWRNGDLVMKPISSSRIPIEPAPWKLQPDLNRSSQRPVTKKLLVPACDTRAFPSIYGEFDRRLKDFDFQHSAKDIRALKQILDAIQKKGLPQVENEEVSGSGSPRDQDADSDHLDLNIETPKQKMLPTGARTSVLRDLNIDTQKQKMLRTDARTSVLKVSQESSVRTLRSTIVVMKPVKRVEKSDVAASSVIRSEGVQHLKKPQSSHSAVHRRDQNPKTVCRTPSFTPVEKKLQQLHRAKNRSSADSAGSVSPRMQKKKFELEKKPRPKISTNSYNAAKLGLKKFQQPTFSGSPGVKPQSKPASLPQCDAQSSEASTEVKNASYYAIDDDKEVTSKLRLDLADGAHSPARKVARQVVTGIRKNKPSLRMNENVGRLALLVPEVPSPVSFLHSAMYRDDCPSPVKMLASSIAAGLTSDMSCKKLKHIDDLVNKLRGLNSTHNESNTDYIASLSQNTSPDQRYISQILLASGFLLLDLGSSSTALQLHSSGNPINPQLFFVLEQTKSRTAPKGDLITSSKSHRRLIFDSVNEILAKDLDSLGMLCSNSDLSSKTKKLVKRSITSQKLLNNLCSQIEKMQSRSQDYCSYESFDMKHENDDDALKNILQKDVTKHCEDWTSFDRTIPEVVLNIERMLFKDLVKEIVMDEVAASSRSSALSCSSRKLSFS